MSSSNSTFQPSSSSSIPDKNSSPQSIRRKHVPWTTHTIRQLKLVLPGWAITYYLGTLHNFWYILQGNGGSWAQTAALASSGLGITTVALFIYVLLIPWLTGEEPNYQTWRDSGILSSVIPVLTGSIVFGWLLSVSTMGQFSNLGYIKGTIGVSAFYALTFGILGLIPVPRVTRKTKI
ncbi:hypothetical protein CVT24_007124 [Panaeolus cyanescens]|uniref:Transmembrane protein n=1 Tax=Panaeolus cyanescens TaxID=181874 RepID=A0A409VJV2_9AGAR|nr:hypothetical protein CVT24_007124 [Panaeolus cyanescens]